MKFRKLTGVFLGVSLFAGAAESIAARPERLTDAGHNSSVTVCSDKNHSPKRALALAAGETEFVRSIFGDSVDTTDIRKYFLGVALLYHKGAHPVAACMCTDSQSFEFFGTAMRADDFSQANINMYGVFIHEMTHLWQRQNGIPYVEGAYDYSLDGRLRLTDYNTEQQAAIVEDYARHFLHSSQSNARHLQGEATPENLALLAKVVEDRFPGAQKTRLALEAEAKEQAQNARLAVTGPALR